MRTGVATALAAVLLVSCARMAPAVASPAATPAAGNPALRGIARVVVRVHILGNDADFGEAVSARELWAKIAARLVTSPIRALPDTARAGGDSTAVLQLDVTPQPLGGDEKAYAVGMRLGVRRLAWLAPAPGAPAVEAETWSQSVIVDHGFATISRGVLSQDLAPLLDAFLADARGATPH